MAGPKAVASALIAHLETSRMCAEIETVSPAGIR